MCEKVRIIFAIFEEKLNFRPSVLIRPFIASSRFFQGVVGGSEKNPHHQYENLMKPNRKLQMIHLEVIGGSTLARQQKSAKRLRLSS